MPLMSTVDIVEAAPQPSVAMTRWEDGTLAYVTCEFAVRADCPIPASVGQYYFEVEVTRDGGTG